MHGSIDEMTGIGSDAVAGGTVRALGALTGEPVLASEWLPAGLRSQLLDAGDYFVHLAMILVPLFLVASFLVGLVEEYLPPERIERTLRAYDEGSGNVVAAGIGAATPFCSCSTIPILAGLLQAGAPLGLAFSFLLASPLVNWLAVALLPGIFGLQVTAAYVVMTLLAAVVGGIVIGRLGLEAHVKDVDLYATDRAAVADGGQAESACGCGDADDAAVAPARSHRDRVIAAGRGAWEFLVDMFPYLLVGMVVGAVIHGAPESWIQDLLGTTHPLIVPVAAVVGAPVYISMSAMLPIAAGFADQGVPIGTVLAFVVGSAGVSLPNLIILNKLFDRRLLAIYAFVVVAIGTVVGLTFNAAFV